MTTDGLPIAFPSAVLVLKAMLAPAWEMLLPDPLVLARLAEVEVGELLAVARNAAERGDWHAIQALIADARARFVEHPWVIEALENMAALAKSINAQRFRKEAMYASRRFAHRLASKEESLSTLVAESAAPSFLRRRTAQGKAQFEKGRDDPQ